MISDDTPVALSDVRHMICRPKFQEWCEQHGLGYREVMRHGLTVGQLRGIGDGYAMRVVELMEEKARVSEQ
jgi:hypothetical protein